MDIPAMSMGISANNVSNQVAVSVMKKTMDQVEVQGQAITEMMKSAGSGKLDVYA